MPLAFRFSIVGHFHFFIARGLLVHDMQTRQQQLPTISPFRIAGPSQLASLWLRSALMLFGVLAAVRRMILKTYKHYSAQSLAARAGDSAHIWSADAISVLERRSSALFVYECAMLLVYVCSINGGAPAGI